MGGESSRNAFSELRCPFYIVPSFQIEVFASKKVEDRIEMLRITIDKVGSIIIGLPLPISKQSREVSVRIAQKVLLRSGEALAADVENDAIRETQKVFIVFLINYRKLLLFG